MHLIAASDVGADAFEEVTGKPARLVHAADEEQGLTQLGEYELMEEYAASCGHALHGLFQEWEGLRSTASARIRRA